MEIKDLSLVAVGNDRFYELREKKRFYIDKTDFILDWWYSPEIVTLITRPRRFGKTLNMSMMNCFFSTAYHERTDLFEGLKVWEDENVRKEQGTWPVLFLTFAGVKQATWEGSRQMLNEVLQDARMSFVDMMKDEMFSDEDRDAFYAIRKSMSDATAATALHNLCEWLERYYGKKPLIFLDEYDTPMQEAWVNGYWNEMINYIRNLFNNTFKTDPHFSRAILTGITRISKESIFSDMNNLTVFTTTSPKYATAFGFTEKEVFEAMDARGLSEKDKLDVKEWYDGFNFGMERDIYNPWSVTNYLNSGELKAWWVNTSGNALIGNLLQRGNAGIKIQMEKLLHNEILTLPIDEEIVFNQLDDDPEAVWSLMLASGYLKVVYETDDGTPLKENGIFYNLAVTNRETRLMLNSTVRRWFKRNGGSLPRFMDRMLRGDLEDMEDYLNQILEYTISYFDPGQPKDAPESFYHGLVLGMIVETAGDYDVRSNRESGFGRYDVVMEPSDRSKPAVILEFKVFNPRREKTLEETAAKALNQIEEMKYDTELLKKGIPAENIRKYGIAFRGKECIVRTPAEAA